MAIYKLLLPKMGESVSEATLTKWVKQVGDQIEEDDAVVEIATDKVDSDIPSPVRGVLKDRLFEENQVVQVGEAIALIETDDQDQALEIEESHDEVGETDSPSQVTENEFSLEDKAIPGIEEIEQSRSDVVDQERPPASNIRFYSPLVRNIAQQEGISQAELDQISGTGGEGRVTKDDVLNYLQQRSGNRFLNAEQGDSDVQATPLKIDSNSVNDIGGEEEIVEMDRMRRLIADHMVQSVKTS